METENKFNLYRYSKAEGLVAEMVDIHMYPGVCRTPQELAARGFEQSPLGDPEDGVAFMTCSPITEGKGMFPVWVEIAYGDFLFPIQVDDLESLLHLNQLIAPTVRLWGDKS